MKQTGLLVAALLASSASAAKTPITTGDSVSGEIAGAAQVDAYTFQAAAGQRVFVQRTASSNYSKLNWRLSDAFGRPIAEDLASLGHLGPVPLMGGDYTLEVLSEGGGLGTYTFIVHSVTDQAATVEIGVPVTGALTTPGQHATHSVVLDGPRRLYLDYLTSSNAFNMNWSLVDDLDNAIAPFATSLINAGPFWLPGGTYTLHVRGEGDYTGSYEFALVEAPIGAPVPLEVGVSVDGEIAAKGQELSYTLTPADGLRVFVDVQSASNANGLNHRLEAPSGAVLFGWTTSLDDQGCFTVLGGPHTYRIRSEGEGTGTYTVRVIECVASTVPITLGAPVSGTIGTPGGSIVYTFDAFGGERIVVDAGPSTNVTGLNWSLRNADGRVLRSRTTSMLDSDPYTLAPGSYEVAVQGEGAATGIFELTLVPVVDTSQVGLLGGSIAGTLGKGQVDRWAFTAPANELLTVERLATSNLSGLNFRVIDAAGSEIVSRTSTLNNVGPVALMGGDYVIEVLGETGNEGTYDLLLRDDGPASYAAPAGTPMALGAAVTGTLTAGQPAVFDLAIAETTKVFLDLTLGANGMQWTLTDPAGRTRFAAAQARYATDDRGPYVFRPGTYSLRVEHPAGGIPSYAFTAHAVVDTSSAGAPGEELAVTTSVPGQSHTVTIALAEQGTYFVDLLAGANDVLWTLTDPAGQPVFNQAEARYPSSQNQGPFVLPAGDYTLAVDPAGDDVATVSFIIRAPEDTSATAEVGETLAVTTSGPGAVHSVDVTLSASTVVYLDVISGTNDLFWQMDRLANGQPTGEVFGRSEVRYSTDDRGRFTLPAGDYRIVFDPDQDIVGQATVALLAVDSGVTPIVLDQTVTATLPSPGHVHRYAFTLSEPRRVMLDMLKGANNLYGDLVHESGFVLMTGNHLNSASDGFGPATLPAGDYELVLASNGGTTGEYSFVVRASSDALGGLVALDALITAPVLTPGDTLSFEVSPAVDGQTLRFDLMGTAPSGFRWSLVDPAGHPLWSGLNATSWSTHDRGPIALASGTYTLTFDPDGDVTGQQSLRVISESAAGAVPQGCAKCSALDLVFLFDTSGSMADNETELCGLAADLIGGLGQQGIPVHPTIWGISDLSLVPCITSHVVQELGPEVPSPLAGKELVNKCEDGGGGATENWAPATAIVAERFAWSADSVRLIVPVADEGPYCGDPLNGNDDLAIDHAAAVSVSHSAVVSPLMPGDVPDPLRVHAIRLATETQGTALIANFDPEALLPAITALAHAACSTETEAARPTLEGVEPGEHLVLPAGVPVVLSGRFVPVNALRPVVDVHVGGTPVEGLDAFGRFFHPVTLEPGETVIPIVAVESCGAFHATITLHAAPVGSSAVEDYVATPGLSSVARDTTWHPGLRSAFGQVAVTSEAAFPIDGPVLMVLGTNLDPQITMSTADGTLPDGRPYRVVLDATETLVAGETGPWVDLVFKDPPRRRIRPTVTWLSPKNHPPVFTSVPNTAASPGKLYTYTPAAFDADGHELTWSLVTAPAAMTLAGGLLSWTPAGDAVGLHDVALMVDDGRGGSAVQRFTVAVGGNAGNVPPLFVSVALTQAAVGSHYLYDSDAIDLDGDAVTFALASGPEGLTLDPETGIASWPFALPGHHAVVLEAADGKGGVASQQFTLTVGELSTNPHAPIITSTPPVAAVAGAPWFYPVLASDPDGDALIYTLETGPPGMTVSPIGHVTWVPSTDDLGAAAVSLSVSDGLGGVATQAFTLQVVATLPDQPPQIVSVPAFTALVGTAYTYIPVAMDPEGLAVTLDLPAGPAGATLVDGTLTWTPDVNEVGQTALSVRATDPGGLSGHQAWLVTVRAENADPVIKGLPPVLTVTAGVAWSYAPSSFDADGDPLAFSVLDPPAGLTVDAKTGVVRWTPLPAQAGTHTFALVVTDPFGGSASMTMTLEVIHDAEPPFVELLTTPAKACLGEKFQVCVLASDDTGVTGRDLNVNGAKIALPGGVCAFVPVTGEALALHGTATDAAGNVGTADVIMPTTDCANDPPPEVTIVSPQPNAAIAGPVDIVATITDNTPADLTWTVETALDGTDEWTTIGSGSGATDAAVVAHFDPTLRTNGTWRVRIIGNDGIQTGGVETWYGVTGDYKLGNFRIGLTDALLSVGGIPLSVTRHYDSLDPRQGDFGVGWRMSLSAEARDSADEVESDGPLDLIQLFLTEAYTRTTRVEVVRPDGERVGFTFAADPKGFPTPLLVTPRFEPDPGVEDTLELLPEDQKGIFDYGGVFYAFILPFNPSTFLFTTRQGVVYRIHETKGLEHVEDVNGNTLTVTKDGVTSSLGPSLAFERDELGRITRIVLPEAEPGEDPVDLTYAYDAAGSLASVTGAEGHTTKYAYEEPGYPHYLTRIEDPLGRPMIRTVFDDSGRLIGVCPADGDPVTLEGCQAWSHDPVAGTSTYHDANGNRLDRFYDGRGNVVVERRWLDAANWAEKVFVYDEHDNLLQRTDSAGNTWTYTYDAKGRPTSTTDPSGERVWTTVWDSHCDERALECDPLGSCVQSLFDDKCRLVTLIDQLGGLTSYTYDKGGHLLAVTDAAGATWTHSYNGLGLVKSTTDPSGNTETTTYNGRGDLIGRVDRDGQELQIVRDNAGQIVKETWLTEPPVTAVMEYNAAGQLTHIAGPNATFTIDYWATGHVKSLDNAGSPGSPHVVVTYGEVVDGALVRGYDGNGNVTAVTDSLGGTTRWTWTPLNALGSVTQQGETTARVDMAYDKAGALTTITRSPGLTGVSPAIVSTFSFDCGGCPTRLTGITHRRASDDSVLHAMTLTRDLVSRVTAMTDAEGSHTYTWDGRHRLLGATHPGGEVETYGYDPVGNRTSSHASVTNVYSVHRLIEDDTWTYSYDKRGNLTQRQSKATGARAELSWDLAGRLVRVRAYDGDGTLTDEVEHVYAWGGRRLRSVIGGQTYHYVYDRENPFLVLDGSGQVLARRLYAHVTDRVLAEERGGELRWLLEDHVGTIRDVVSADGATILEHFTMDSFGKMDGAPDPLDLVFTARDRDPVTGFEFHRARWYDPATGRFISEDPEQPRRYEYAENAPLIFIDPSGRSLTEYQLILVDISCTVLSAISSSKGYAATARQLWSNVERAVSAALAGDPSFSGTGLDGVPPPLNEFSLLPCGLGEIPGALQ